MPRIPRGQQAAFVYHVINRGNGRATIFHKAQDYDAFHRLKSDSPMSAILIKGLV